MRDKFSLPSTRYRHDAHGAHPLEYLARSSPTLHLSKVFRLDERGERERERDLWNDNFSTMRKRERGTRTYRLKLMNLIVKMPSTSFLATFYLTLWRRGGGRLDFQIGNDLDTVAWLREGISFESAGISISLPSLRHDS